MNVDFGKTASDYAKHRPGFPEVFFARLGLIGVGKAAQRVLDLGTGTGVLARDLSKRGCHVIGLDPSPELLAEARTHVGCVRARAEALPFADGAFDVVTAGQCWHWFDRDGAAREAARVLAPSGKLVLAYRDWISIPNSVPFETEQLIQQFNPPWNQRWGCGLNSDYLDDLQRVGLFAQIESFSLDVNVPFSHEGWRGRIRASWGVGASLPPDEVERFDKVHAEMLRAKFPAPALIIPHRIGAMYGVRIA